MSVAYDHQSMLEAVGGNTGIANMIAGVFREDVKQKLSELEQNLDRWNVAEARRLCHAISGAAGTAAATHLSKLIDNVKESIKTNNSEEAKNGFLKAMAEYQQYCNESLKLSGE